VKHNLEAAGLGVEDVVKLTWYVVGAIDPQRRREVLMAWLGDHRPASTFLYVAGLASPEYKVEIDALAAARA
jgi:enamine deaminase RidA (YjgF/YER057c/UK114 family)